MCRNSIRARLELVATSGVKKVIIPLADAKVSVHLAAMNIGFRSDIGLAVMIFPPTA